LSRHLGRVREEEIDRFLQRHAGTVVGERLRQRWLDHLAGQERWADFLAAYQAADQVSLQCHRLNALLHTGQRSQALAQVDAIWLHGRSRPKSCDPVFAAWERAGLRTDQKTWQRIALAMQAGEWRLARYLSRPLGDNDKAWVERWISLYRDPTKTGEDARYARPHPYREVMLAQAVRRHAIRDGLQAMQRWQRIKPRYAFTPEQISETEHYIVRNLVRVGDPSAYAFIRQVDFDKADEKAHNARIRAALLRQDWPQVIQWIEILPSDLRSTPRWRYWHARALESIGDTSAASALYAEVAAERSYYGFMAADRVGADYHLDHIETPVDPQISEQIAAMPAVRRARELFHLERWVDARREWQSATADMEPAQLKAAAKIAEQKGWHDRAIFTLARTGYWDDLELRFPLEHTDLVERNADRNGIDEAWIFAVMRQESAFMHNARSHAGAMGLMQLMPATARAVARDLKLKPPRRHDLLQPETNIALGSTYLRQMKERLGDSAIFATAAYNAGPHRIPRWLPEQVLPADIWIELIPFRETRRYLERVLAYTAIYESRMGLSPTRLERRLHPVGPQIDLVTANLDAG
jgi:soluble lytic murein transglycosylase